MYHAYCDGACRVHGSKSGGWAVVLLRPDGPEEVDADAVPNTTNNRMELTAVINALDMVPQGSTIVIHTDSMWVIGVLSRGWKAKANLDLVAQATYYQKTRTVLFQHHPRRSTPELEYVDNLAASCAARLDKAR